MRARYILLRKIRYTHFVRSIYTLRVFDIFHLVKCDVTKPSLRQQHIECRRHISNPSGYIENLIRDLYRKFRKEFITMRCRMLASRARYILLRKIRYTRCRSFDIHTPRVRYISLREIRYDINLARDLYRCVVFGRCHRCDQLSPDCATFMQ